MKTKLNALQNKIKSQWERLTKKEKIILIILIILLPLILYTKLYFIPKRQKLKMLEQEKIKLKNKIAKLKKLKKKKKELEDKNRKIKETLKIAKKILPNKTEIADLLNKIAEEQKKFGVEISEFKAKKERTKENFYAEIPLEIKLKGNYNNIMLFLDNIRKKERILNPYNIQIKREKEKLNASTEIMTYRILTEEERKKLKTKKKK